MLKKIFVKIATFLFFSMNLPWIEKYDTLLESSFHFQLTSVSGKQKYLRESVNVINAAAACTSWAEALLGFQNGKWLSKEVTNWQKFEWGISNRRLIRGWRFLYENCSKLSNLRINFGGFEYDDLQWYLLLMFEVIRHRLKMSSHFEFN